MFQRALDDSYPVEVRHHITTLTIARTTANGCFRFAPPFLAVIAAGNGTDLAGIGIAVAISEFAGLLSPVTGLWVDRMHRRTAMSIGLAGVAAATALAAASVHPAMIAVALVVLAQSKVMFDIGLGAWFADRVPFERRGRVLGITETSWALGLLVGVSAMGLVTAVAGWRVGYALGAVAVVTLAAIVARTLPEGSDAHHEPTSTPRVAVPWTRVAPLLAASACLMGSSQALFVTFGSWLDERFGFSAAALSAVAFGMGLGELFASLMSARHADRRGKERSAALGAALIVPAAVGLVVLHTHLWVGLPLLVLAVAAFEFGLVSAVPLGTDVIADSPVRGLALMLGAGTLGRSLVSVPATRLYAAHGMAAPALLCASLAVAAALAFTQLARRHARESGTAAQRR